MSAIVKSESGETIYMGKSGINYTEASLFYYERRFFDDKFIESLRDFLNNYGNTSIYYAIAYVVTIFGLQAYMRTRPKFDLRQPLIVWNCFLAGFSILGTVRVWPDFVSTFYTKGLVETMCSSNYVQGVFGAWSWLFIMSKLPELIDTVFIVLRKQELIFLHWYHHITVLIYCWIASKEFPGSGRWFVLMNYTVHAAMYTYFALRAMRFRIPKWVNMTITTGQIVQMVVGLCINFVAYYQKNVVGVKCDISDVNFRWAFLMYFTYFVLFFHFFYQAYMSKPNFEKNKLQQQSEPVKNGSLQNGHHYKNGHHHHHVNGVVNDETKKIT